MSEVVEYSEWYGWLILGAVWNSPGMLEDELVERVIEERPVDAVVGYVCEHPGCDSLAIADAVAPRMKHQPQQNRKIVQNLLGYLRRTDRLVQRSDYMYERGTPGKQHRIPEQRHRVEKAPPQIAAPAPIQIRERVNPEDGARRFAEAQARKRA